MGKLLIVKENRQCITARLPYLKPERLNVDGKGNFSGNLSEGKVILFCKFEP